MAVPVFLSVPFRFKEILTTDVADIITALRDELVTQPAAENKWTEPVSGTFKSPALSGGVFWTLTATKISATRIAYIMKDQNGLIVNNQTDTRQDIAATSTYVRIYTSPYYVFVDSANPAQNECFACGVLDRTPEPLSDPRACYWCSRGPRDSTGTYNSTNNNWGFTYIYYATNRAYGAYGYALDKCVISGTYADMFTLAGTMLFYPLEYVDGAWFLGRLSNTLLTDCSQSDQATFEVPLDANTTGTFRITGWNIINTSKVAVRVA